MTAGVFRHSFTYQQVAWPTDTCSFPTPDAVPYHIFTGDRRDDGNYGEWTAHAQPGPGLARVDSQSLPPAQTGGQATRRSR